MPKKEKVPKKYKVESRSLSKKINEAVHDPSKFQGMSQVEKNQILAAIQGSPDYQRLYATLNPSDKQYIDMNIGSPKGREAGLFRSEKPHLEKISNLTPEQSRAAYSFLEQTIPEAFLPVNATPEQIQTARGQGLGGTLSALEKPYESSLNTQLNDMFGHMANPVLQNFLNPSQGQNAQVLFPSQLAQHQQGGGLESLLGQLAQQYAPQIAEYGIENAPAAYEALRGIGAQGLQYGQQAGQYAAQSRPGLAAQDIYGFAKTLPGSAYKDISQLLSTLGSYIPGRGQQPQG